MKKGYRLGIISMFAFFMIGVCGCTMNQADAPQNTQYELNERQKSILAEVGLSTEYEELLPSHKSAIVAIEEMLQYAEDKYGIPFAYAGYAAPSLFSPLGGEYMYAYPTSGSKNRDMFTITKTENGYEDDYIETAASEGFAAYVQKGLKKIYPDVEIKVFGDITHTTLTEVPTDNTQYDGNVSAMLCIFIDDGSQVEENTNVYRDGYIAFMNEHGLRGSAQIICLYEGNIADITDYNYTDYLFKKYYWSREDVYV